MKIKKGMPVNTRTSNRKRIFYFRGTIAVIGWAALVAQFTLSAFDVSDINTYNPLGALNNFSYYTVQTSIFALLYFSLKLRRSSEGEKSFSGWITSFPVKTALTAYTCVTGIVFGLMLAPYMEKQIWYISVVVIILHYVLPLALILDWIIEPAGRKLKSIHAGLFLLYPVAYAVFTTVFGSVTGWHPYPMIAIDVLGPVQAIRNYLILLAFSLFLYMIFFFCARLKKKQPEEAQDPE